MKEERGKGSIALNHGPCQTGPSFLPQLALALHGTSMTMVAGPISIWGEGN